MTLSDRSPRLALAVALLALLPIAWYGLAGSATAGALAAINVSIVLVALWLALGPVGLAPGDENGPAA